MADIKITVDGGTSKRLLTAGKYCDKNILVTATGGGGTEPEPPQDGKTRLYIRIPANAKEGLPPPRNQVPLYITQTVESGVTIDWGDGTAPETLPGTGGVNTIHTYQQEGDYVISLEPANGCKLGFGNPSSQNSIMGPKARNYNLTLFKAYIGDSVETIVSYAFSSCYSLTSVVISDSVTSIEGNAFLQCYSLASVVIPNSVISIGTSAFSSCYSLTSVVIPNSVTYIESNTFSSCYSLTSVVIPNSVTGIGTGAFYSCYSLASVVIPNSVISIGPKAFYNCYSLTSMVIPDSVTNIGKDAFSYCFFIKEYHILPTTPPGIQTKTFTNIPSDCIIYVPIGTAETYKAATNWTTHADKIQEEPNV